MIQETSERTTLYRSEKKYITKYYAYSKVVFTIVYKNNGLINVSIAGTDESSSLYYIENRKP